MSPWLPVQSSQNEIRLLLLEPSSDQTSRLVCQLTTVCLNDDPEYEALSYVCGDPTDRKSISLCGQEVSVTLNLFEALTHLRHQDTPRCLWADAICINQLDLTERASQVGIMDLIYSKATTTLVWLGECADLLKQVREVARNPSTHFKKYPYAALDLITPNKWWTRAWTLQEGVLSRDLVFYSSGTRNSFDFKDLEAFNLALDKHFFSDQACCEKMRANPPLGLQTLVDPCTTIQDLASRRHCVSKGEKFDLLDLLFTYNSRGATDLRDRVFAYAGLAQNVPVGLIDYRRSLSHCFLQCAKALIEDYHGLEVLSYITHPVPHDLNIMQGSGYTKETIEISVKERGTPLVHGRMKSLPSWCPDWGQELPSAALAHLSQYHKNRTRFLAGKDTAMKNMKVSFPDDGSLRVEGAICDVVAEIGRYQTTSPRRSSDDWQAWCGLVGQSPCYWSSLDCGVCKIKIWGIRHKCTVCENFNLCAICVTNQQNGHPNHFFDVIRPKSPELVGPTISKDQEPTMSGFHKAVFKETDDQIGVQPGTWETLGNARYPFTQRETVQDAFRGTLMMGISGLSIKDRESIPEAVISLVDAVAFIEFWSTMVEKRPFVMIGRRQGVTEEQVKAVSQVIDTEHVRVVSNRVHVMTEWRRLLVTKKGYIGLGPAGMMPGDVVCVLHGARVPHILRKLPAQGIALDGKETEYTLIGDAYVHGLMKGEALKMEREGMLEKTEIVIR